jgi:acyl-CoA synthetase (AMP-forming)/AMP-acid ligase II
MSTDFNRVRYSIEANISILNHIMQPPRILSLLTMTLLLQVIQFVPIRAAEPTVIKNTFAAKELLGARKINLQWIGWENWREFGDLQVVDRNGTLYLKGQQTKGEDYLKIDGEVVSIKAREFVFQGSVITRVSHNNNGKPCERYGKMLFKITQNRKYWRLQEMKSPCGTETDYVDIFMR